MGAGIESTPTECKCCGRIFNRPEPYAPPCMKKFCSVECWNFYFKVEHVIELLTNELAFEEYRQDLKKRLT